MNERNDATRVALVTGSNGAIGGAVLTRLRLREFRVWGLDRRLPDNSIPDGPFIQADLGKGESLPSFKVPEAGLDYVFHIAGGALPSEVESGTLLNDAGDIERTLRDNLISAIDVIHATVPLMRTGGSITLTSSINALSNYGLPVYSASKAAIHGLVVALAPSLAREGIRLNVAVLGTVIHKGVELLHASSPGHFESLRRETSGGVLLTPDTAAKAIVELGVDDLSVSGAAVVIDNGQLASRGRA
jgi:NAD(P)-dependent dehydrogenase (short-subunit alcohol dehydrogenase family)